MLRSGGARKKKGLRAYKRKRANGSTISNEGGALGLKKKKRGDTGIEELGEEGGGGRTNKRSFVSPGTAVRASRGWGKKVRKEAKQQGKQYRKSCEKRGSRPSKEADLLIHTDTSNGRASRKGDAPNGMKTQEERKGETYKKGHICFEGSRRRGGKKASRR